MKKLTPKFLISLFFLLLVSLGPCAIFLISHQEKLLLSMESDAGKKLIMALSNQLVEAILEEDYVLLDETLKKIGSSNEKIVSIEILKGDESISNYKKSVNPKEKFLISTPIEIKDDEGGDVYSIGTVQFLLDKKHINEEINSVTLLIAYSFLIAYFLIFVPVLFLIRRKLLRPIGKLVSLTSKIGAGDFAVFEKDQFDGELDTLKDSINLMGKNLKHITFSKDYVDSILGTISEMILVFNSDDELDYFNKSFSERTANAPDLSKSKLNQVLFSSVGKDYVGIDEFESVESGEIFLKINDDDFLPVMASLSISKSDSKKIIVLKDLSEVKELEEKVIVSAKLASIGELAAGVAHEINNPLTIIAGQIFRINKSLKELPESLSTIKGPLDIQEKSIGRIKGIVEGLRIYSRTEAQIESNFDVLEVIQNSFKLLESIYFNSNINLKLTDNSNTKLLVKGDGPKFQQVVMNFLGNAKDAILEVKDSGTIEVILGNDDKKIFVNFLDDGKGISEKDRKKIFDAFFTTKAVGKGTGLGLSISLNIINQMKGNLSLDGDSVQGANFLVELPLANLQDQSDLDTKTDDLQLNQKINLKGINILVVEDEKEIRDILVEIFSGYGANCSYAVNGEDALDMIDKNTFDVIFTDAQMPKLDGLGLLKNLRDGNKFDGVTVVLTGGTKSEKDHEELKTICDFYFTKPMKEKDFHEVFKSLSS